MAGAQDLRCHLKGCIEAADSISPLHRAAEHDLGDLVEWLLANGSDPSKRSAIGLPFELAISGRDARINRTENLGLRTVKALLQPGLCVDVNAATEKFSPPLSLAICKGASATIKLLLEAGAIVDMRTIPALKYTLSDRYTSGRMLHVFMGISQELNVAFSGDIRDGLAKLHLSMDSITKAGLNLVAQMPSHSSDMMKPLQAALHDAARTEMVGTINMLLPYVRELDIYVDSDGRNALQIASLNGHYDATRLLLSSGVDPDIRGMDGNTAGHFASAELPTSVSCRI